MPAIMLPALSAAQRASASPMGKRSDLNSVFGLPGFGQASAQQPNRLRVTIGTNNSEIRSLPERIIAGKVLLAASQNARAGNIEARCHQRIKMS